MALPFLLGLLQGLLHALGPDHCAAVVTLGGARGPRSALLTALRFGAGHALALGTIAAACLVLGIGLSERFERWAELLGGAVLIALAVTALLFPGALQHGHPHWTGAHGSDHRHLPLPLAAGALMALSGARSLLLALPPLLLGGSFSAAAWSYLPGFALGVVAGMGALGCLVSFGLGRLSGAWPQRLHRAAALVSVALGVVWMAMNA